MPRFSISLPLALTAISASFLLPSAEANIAENTGFGSRTTALAGAGASWGAGPFSTYSNPAELSAFSASELVSTQKSPPLQASWGLVFLTPQFKSIQNVVLENNYVSDKTPARSGDVDTSYRDTFGQAFALSYRLSEGPSRLTVGLTGFIPINQLAYADTGETYIPEYVLERSRTQRPQFAAAGGMQITRAWSLGAGVGIGFALTGNGSVFLNTDPNKPSTMRFSASMKPKALPYAGLLYHSAKDELTAGLVFRAPVSSPNEYTLNSGARAFGNLAALDFNFKADSALYYDPLSIELGGSYAVLQRTRIVAQLEYQRWSNFEPPALSIQNPQTGACTGTGCSGGIQISPSKNPSFNFNDTWVPRLGVEHQLNDDQTFRFGYFYRPGIIDPSQLSGAGNLLDPPRHAFSAGFGWRFHHFLHLDTPFTLDVDAQFQTLQTQTITKSAGNEAGTSSDQKIGAPGYQAGGKIFGGGLTLSWAF